MSDTAEMNRPVFPPSVKARIDIYNDYMKRADEPSFNARAVGAMIFTMSRDLLERTEREMEGRYLMFKNIFEPFQIELISDHLLSRK